MATARKIKAMACFLIWMPAACAWHGHQDIRHRVMGVLQPVTNGGNTVRRAASGSGMNKMVIQSIKACSHNALNSDIRPQVADRTHLRQGSALPQRKQK